MCYSSIKSCSLVLYVSAIVLVKIGATAPSYVMGLTTLTHSTRQPYRIQNTCQILACLMNVGLFSLD